MINLDKLAKIIQLNSHSVKDHYSIWLELIETNLILYIEYSYEFIEWSEQIVFTREKNYPIQN